MFAWPAPAYAFAGIAAVAIVAWLGVRTLRPPSAEQLLAQAYTEHRTLEVRIRGAKFAPLKVERSSVGSSLDKPSSLLKAEALISDNLKKDPNDPKWLEARARADLLDGNYESAIQSLQRALETQPDSPELLADLGSAYFLRAESRDRAIDYGNAIESLSKALAKSPDDLVALFNRAIASERMFLYQQAINDWEHYLRVEPKSDWADEARKRLAALKQKLKQHEQSESEPLLSPAEFVTTVSSPPHEGVSSVDQRAEDYLDEAIQRWLPSAFPENQNSSPLDFSAKTHTALALLAKELSTHHQDMWLKDLLLTPASPSFSTGIRYLSNAARANAQGDPDATFLNARLARQWFRKASSQTGELWAQLEEIYALHRQYHGAECLAAVEKIEDDVSSKHYPWIEAQARLEQFACFDPENQRVSVPQLLARARNGATYAKYGTLYLRALAFSASNETGSGSSDRAWEWDRAGLESYWSGCYPPLRAHHFYDDLSISAQDSGKWFLAVALGREAVSAVASSGNRTGEGMERIELARSASHVQLWPEANQQYSKALAAFSSLPQDKSSRAFRATAEIGLADVALSQNQTHEAEAHLNYVRANLPSDFEQNQIWLSLYRASAAFHRQTGDALGARKACEAAVLLSEMDLRGVRSELETLRWKQNGAECYKELVKSKLTEHDETSALELWEWYQSAGTRLPQAAQLQAIRYAEFDQSPVLPSVNAVVAELPSLDRETVIVYAELGDRVSAWVYDNRGVYWQPLKASPADLNRAIPKFAAQCADAKSDLAQLRVSGRNLYDLLFGPLVARLDPNRTLVIEADEDFSLIPFVALVEPSGKYLVDRFRVVYLPSIGYRRVLREDGPVSRQDTALIVASPALSVKDQAYYAPLPDADTEAENVAVRFEHPQFLSGRQASATAVSQALQGATIFHFAGHTRSEPGHSGLLLAPESEAADAEDTTLNVDSIASQAVPRLRLAVLSACSTGRGGIDDAGDSRSLARALLRSGVPDVVATRWPVDSGATAAFMRLFYEHAMKGEEVPAALAVAMNRVRVLAQYSHPYYWAAFDVLGRGSEAGR